MVSINRSTNFDFTPIPPVANDVLINEVKTLWRKNNIVPETEMDERASQITLITRKCQWHPRWINHYPQDPG